jgi:UDP-2,3-diacylglucosamine pyrophosphatase LpxH
MKTDGLFDYRICDVSFSKYNQPISLYCISDVHWNSPACAREAWCSFLKLAKDDRNQKIFLFLGDLFDSLSSSERQSMKVGCYHESTISRWEKDWAKDITDFCKDVDIAKDKTIAVFGGNHFYQFNDGTTSDMCVASMLNAPYIGSVGYIVIRLRYRGTPYTHTIKIFAHHGKGGGNTAGASFNPMEKVAADFGCDILLMGHNHRKGAVVRPRIDISESHGNWKIKAKDTIIARTGSFLKSYEAGTKSYAHDSLFSPSTIGALKILITPMRKNNGNNRKKGCTEDRWERLEAVI